MNFFKTPVIEPPETDEDRLATIEAQYRVAESEFRDACVELVRYRSSHRDHRIHFLNDKLFVSLNAQFSHPELAALEKVRDTKLRVRSALLARRAELMTQMGLVK